MQLRTRLLVGYAYLVALLLVAAGSAALVFLDLSQGIGRLLDENYRSVRAAVHMTQALERQDSLTLALLVDPEADADELATHDAAYAAALEEAEANVTLAGESDVVGRIRAGFTRLREARRQVLAAPGAGLEAYRSGVQPAFIELHREVVRLLEMNHEAMLAADQRARRTATLAGMWLGGLSALALLSLPLMSRALQRGLLVRLRELRETAQAIAGGDAGRRLRERGRDELAFVARQFNRVLDARDELRGRWEGRLAQQRQLVLALLAEVGGGAVLGLDGALLAHDGGAPAEGARRAPLHPGRAAGGGARGAPLHPGFSPADLEMLRGWARGPGREAARASTGAAEVELADGRRLRLKLLAAGGRRPVGWLVLADD
jgi:hypothetical protein